MKGLRFSLFSILYSLIILTQFSCSQGQEATHSRVVSAANDTTVLRVAVMPAMNCLPLFYAERSCLADSLGLDMVLLRFQAQMDIDTAIINGHVDIAYTDLIRQTRLSKQVDLTPLASCDEPLSLISLKTKRVKQVNQMKEQMIAISRLSATDYWCDRLLDSTHSSYDDIYRPQVNDVRLRAEMLRQGLIDAAILGEPFATWMTMLGHKRLFQSKGKQPRLYAWAATTATEQQQKDFLNLLGEAIRLMERETEASLVRDILKQEYQLPAEAVDSMALQPISPPTAIQESDIKAAEDWLKGKKKL